MFGISTVGALFSLLRDIIEFREINWGENIVDTADHRDMLE